MATTTEPRRKAARSFQTKMLIGGRWQESRSGKTLRDGQPRH